MIGMDSSARNDTKSMRASPKAEESVNNLTGSIPEEIYSIPRMGSLDLAGNSFTGT
eukprot:gene31224-38582_t